MKTYSDVSQNATSISSDKVGDRKKNHQSDVLMFLLLSTLLLANPSYFRVALKAAENVSGSGTTSTSPA